MSFVFVHVQAASLTPQPEEESAVITVFTPLFESRQFC
jgi:hypothetical protein